MQPETDIWEPRLRFSKRCLFPQPAPGRAPFQSHTQGPLKSFSVYWKCLSKASSLPSRNSQSRGTVAQSTQRPSVNAAGAEWTLGLRGSLASTPEPWSGTEFTRQPRRPAAQCTQRPQDPDGAAQSQGGGTSQTLSWDGARRRGKTVKGRAWRHPGSGERSHGGL